MKDSQRTVFRLALGLLCLLAALSLHAARGAAQSGVGAGSGGLVVDVVMADGNEVTGALVKWRVSRDPWESKVISKEDLVERKRDQARIRIPVRQGMWSVEAKKGRNYKQPEPRPRDVWVKTDVGGQVDLRLSEEVTPTPAPAPAPGGLPRIVLVLYRQETTVKEEPDVNQALVCKPSAADAGKAGRVAPVGAASLWGQVVKAASSGATQSGGMPLKGASLLLFRVNLETGKQELIAEGKSGADGCFNLPYKTAVPKEGERYLFSASLDDYESYDDLMTPEALEAKSKSGQSIPLAESPTVVVTTGEPPAPIIETKEATRRHVFTPSVMEVLPLPGLRNFDSFALLAPGVVPPPETPNARGPGVSPGLGTAGQFSVNGLRPRENNFTVDGSDNNDEDIGARRQGFVVLSPQAVESLNEFQVITALADARYGRNIGGQVNALTKGGTSRFHGSVYGLVTDSRLNARNFFDQTTGGNPTSFTLERQSDGADVLLDGRPIVSPNPVGGENPLTRTQLGFAVGGPVPQIDSLFFVSLERVKARAARESHFVVPTVEERGLFGAGATGLLLEREDEPDVALHPATVPGNAVFSLYPFPNNPLGPYGRNTYTAILPADADGTRLSVKLDRRFGTFGADDSRPPWSFLHSGDTLTARYNIAQETSAIPVTGQALFSSLRPRVRTQSIAFFLDRALTGRISDAIRVSVGRTKLTFREARDPLLSPSFFFPGEQLLLNAPLLLNVTAPLPDGTLTQPAYLSASSPQGTALLAALGYSGVTSAEQVAGPLGQVIVPGFSPLGTDVYHFPQSRANTTIQAADTVTFVNGAGHIFHFGVDIKKTLVNSTLDKTFRPLAVFSGLRTSTPSPNLPLQSPGGGQLPTQLLSGTTLAAAGVPTGLFQTLSNVPNSTVGLRFTQTSFFAQSGWRLSDNLHLQLGTRFGYLTRLSTKGNTLERAFDREQLRRQSAGAIEDCVRISQSPDNRPECVAVAQAIISAFPADFTGSFGGDRLDLDQRLGLAWSLDDRTVVRGGFGTYSGEFPGIVVGQARNAFPSFLPVNFADLPIRPSNEAGNRVFLFNPANPILRESEPGLSLAPGSLNALLPNVSALSLLTTRAVLRGQERPFSRNVLGLDLVLPQERLQTPYSLQYAVTLERKLSERYALSVAYVGTRGIKLLRLSTPELGPLRSRLLESAGLKVTTQGDSPFPFPGGVLLPPQESVPRALLAISRTLFESSASSTYNSLQVEVRKHYAERFQFRTAFTYSHAIDDVSDFFDTAGAFALPQNSFRRSERASSNFDVRLRSVTHFVRDFPEDFFFAGSRWGGWQLAGIVTAQTGQPFTVNSAFDINRDGNLTDRLNSTAGLLRGHVAGDRLVQLSLAPGVNPSDLLADDGADGAVGRNTFRAPGLFSFDLAITKVFNFNERVKLHARTEIFNLFNHANFGIPVRILESPSFGRATYTTTPPRTIQLVIRLRF